MSGMLTPGSKRGCENPAFTSAGGWIAFARSFPPAGRCSRWVAAPVSRSQSISASVATLSPASSHRPQWLPAMVAKFRARLPGEQTLVSDMRTLSLERRFQATLAWDSFFHLNHEDQRRMFPIFRAHAAPRAALMFTSGPAHGEATGRLEGEPLHHASLDGAEYRKLLEDGGFAVIANRRACSAGWAALSTPKESTSTPSTGRCASDPRQRPTSRGPVQR